MLEGIATGVLVALIVAAILWAVRWLTDWANREGIARDYRKHFCRHDWAPIDTDLGGGLQLVTQYAERCRKCGERR
jgi:hypothetical protein